MRSRGFAIREGDDISPGHEIQRALKLEEIPIRFGKLGGKVQFDRVVQMYNTLGYFSYFFLLISNTILNSFDPQIENSRIKN